MVKNIGIEHLPKLRVVCENLPDDLRFEHDEKETKRVVINGTEIAYLNVVISGR
jgi:hypothetical protein